MARLTDDADYDAGEMFENVSSLLSDGGNPDNYNGRRLRTSVEEENYRQETGMGQNMNVTDLCAYLCVFACWGAIRKHEFANFVLNWSSCFCVAIGSLHPPLSLA
ncbi:unnamed protein product [Protopolystoma xenopodis]|uniref:Uncharacterized protein n=1 Tax=Protopolystoma xenopodis TaxID=117903 RepID=A0A3S5FCG4_9PLAT|nr:unnamed protein product [Protopolystoma xenopodis]